MCVWWPDSTRGQQHYFSQTRKLYFLKVQFRKRLFCRLTSMEHFICNFHDSKSCICSNAKKTTAFVSVIASLLFPFSGILLKIAAYNFQLLLVLIKSFSVKPPSEKSHGTSAKAGVRLSKTCIHKFYSEPLHTG